MISVARGGPGSVTGRKLPPGWPRTEAALVWSWSGGRWWRVDGGSSLAVMQASAVARQAATAKGTRGSAKLGVRPMEAMPGCRFVATLRDGDPQTEWERLQSHA